MIPVSVPAPSRRGRRPAFAAAVTLVLAGGGVAGAAPARAAAAPAPLYVSAGAGSDSNACTAAAPCATIGRALALAAAGATVNVAAGYYTENLTLRNPVTILGAGPAATYIDGQANGPVVVNEATSTLSGLTLLNGKSSIGGGVANFGERLTMNDDHVLYNVAAVAGGGIFSEYPTTLVVTDSIVAANTAGSYGGGISEDPVQGQYSSVGAVTLSGDVIARNILSGSQGLGAGIFGSGLSLDDDTIAGNAAGPADSHGGGIGLPPPDLPADVQPESYQDQMIVGYHLTIADNQASVGGGISVGTGTQPSYGDVTASIVADNQGGNCAAMTLTGGYDLEDDAAASCGVSASNGGVVGQDPQLGQVQDNGGPSWTQALSDASPAHDAIPAASAQCGGSDQIGDPRLYPFAVGCDIGAYEVPTAASLSSGSLDFGSQKLGSATLLSVVLTNTGTETLYPHGLPQSMSDPAFQDAGGSCEGETTFVALAPGASCVFVIEFSPSTAGPYTAAFGFADHIDAVRPEQIVTLSGTGTD